MLGGTILLAACDPGGHRVRVRCWPPRPYDQEPLPARREVLYDLRQVQHGNAPIAERRSQGHAEIKYYIRPEPRYRPCENCLLNSNKSKSIGWLAKQIMETGR